MNPHKKYWPNQPINPSQTMIHRYEKQIHDLCMALFAVGMIGTIVHVALAELADQPIQHSGTQTLERIR